MLTVRPLPGTTALPGASSRLTVADCDVSLPVNSVAVNLTNTITPVNKEYSDISDSIIILEAGHKTDLDSNSVAQAL